jgi:hypothetical protein
LRALDRSVEEIAAELTLAGTPVSAQTVWTILHAEGECRRNRVRLVERIPHAFIYIRSFRSDFLF